MKNEGRMRTKLHARTVEQEICRLEADLQDVGSSSAPADMRQRYLLLLRADGSRLAPRTRAAVAGDLRRVNAGSGRWCGWMAAAPALAAPPALAWLGTDPVTVWLATGIAPLLAWSLSRRILRWSSWRRDAAAFRLDARLPFPV